MRKALEIFFADTLRTTVAAAFPSLGGEVDFLVGVDILDTTYVLQCRCYKKVVVEKMQVDILLAVC